MFHYLYLKNHTYNGNGVIYKYKYVMAYLQVNNLYDNTNG